MHTHTLENIYTHTFQNKASNLCTCYAVISSYQEWAVINYFNYQHEEGNMFTFIVTFAEW